eukprot:TRINITY_DN4130_c0_g1_i1.p1 TRINITY_DN4130_c0_g1~~TRINITY_DN4130_c0_g1_i1.p1  ORF type:complete len:373 (+),score=100.00 TRINITY_DN4130_c0_g1_i1:54-1121(+)
MAEPHQGFTVCYATRTSGIPSDGKEMESEDQSEEERRLTEALRVAGARLFSEGNVKGIELKNWRLEACNSPILTSHQTEMWGEKLGTSHLPEMMFGSSHLSLLHIPTGILLEYGAWDALRCWKKENLPPVQIPAAAAWKRRSKPSESVVMDYDYTFTTPYRGSTHLLLPDGTDWSAKSHPLQAPLIASAASASAVAPASAAVEEDIPVDAAELQWVECEGGIDWNLLRQQEDILFFSEVVLFEDELADNGISILSVKVRVMRTCWFLLLRFWLRVDGALMRLRDTRVYHPLSDNGGDGAATPLIIREITEYESTFESLARVGYPKDSSFYSDPQAAADKLKVRLRRREKLQKKSQ